MPDVHIWIRKEDYAKWQAIEDKPEWLHEHLNQFVPNRTVVLPSSGKPNKPNPLKPISMIGRDLCEHYQPKGMCMVKSCKFGRGKK